MQLLEERVSSFFKRSGLVGSRLVVAVSGGADSICLIHVLSTLERELRLTLHIAHVDHSLRHGSADDAEYVRLFAASLKVPATVRRIDVQAYRNEKKLGVEEAAREVRYRFLSQVAEELGASFIATGHTVNDQLETILLHIIRGTGLKGLVGLKPLTPWTMGGRIFSLVRPLLGVSRLETERYCRDHNLKPRLDLTNLSLAPLRNRIRLELLPRLKEYNSGIDAALLRLSSNAGDAVEHFEDVVAELWPEVVTEEAGLLRFDKQAVLALSPAIKAHLFRKAFEKLAGSIKDIEMRHIEDIMSTIILPAGRSINLPYGLTLLVDYKYIWLGRENFPVAYPTPFETHRLNVPGVTVVPGWKIEASYALSELSPESGLSACLDADISGRELVVRTWQRGDRFVPLGMCAEKKLAEFMRNEKIPRRWRQNIPVVASPEKIIWLVGFRLDDRVKVTKATRRILRLEFKMDGEAATDVARCP